MKKLTKTLTALLLAGTTLSLMCGCDNGAAKDKNSSVSGGSSATQSTASEKSDTSSKDESKADDTESKDNSKHDEASDPDYERMMSLVNQIKPDFSRKQVVAIMGEPNQTLPLGIGDLTIYSFGKYSVQIQYTDKLEIGVFDPTKPNNPYNKNAKYDSEFMEVLNKVSSIKQNFTEEEVVKILGEPDETNIVMYSRAYYNYGDYTVNLAYYDGGLMLDIRNTKTGEIVNVLYPS